MSDREKIIKAVETCFDSWIDKHRNNGYDLQTVEQMKHDALKLLKEHGPRWHVFHKCELTEEEKKEYPTWKWIMRVDCVPTHGEQFLLYLKEYNEMVLDYWDDDMWSEYACTMDGYGLEDGDAWMELPKPPEEAQG